MLQGQSSSYTIRSFLFTSFGLLYRPRPVFVNSGSALPFREICYSRTKTNVRGDHMLLLRNPSISRESTCCFAGHRPEPSALRMAAGPHRLGASDSTLDQAIGQAVRTAPGCSSPVWRWGWICWPHAWCCTGGTAASPFPWRCPPLSPAGIPLESRGPAALPLPAGAGGLGHPGQQPVHGLLHGPAQSLDGSAQQPYDSRFRRRSRRNSKRSGPRPPSGNFPDRTGPSARRKQTKRFPGIFSLYISKTS